ncbi:MAG TPA: AmmeMemoRadiSam system protein A, partial [Pyrinomonadaceae bacterium]|nr:AmmeMemoRadiSam system protein A [Pyrinomonadaceae bacterium]
SLTICHGVGGHMGDSLVFSGVAPHPPIMVPEVGRESAREVQRSIDGMEELTRRLIESRAESLVLISPHAPLESDAFVAYAGERIYGDFERFRAPHTYVEAPVDQKLLDAITAEAACARFEVVPLDSLNLDHGIVVPLYFLQRYGWAGSVVALGYSFLSNSDHLNFGRSVHKAAQSTGYPIAVLASGDLSHRLKEDAPAGFDPAAHLFDEEVVAAFESNEPQRIPEIAHDLRRLAGECGYRSMLIALGATSNLPPACEVLSYEAPFGVGYLVAQLTRQAGIGNSSSAYEGSQTDMELSDLLPRIARDAVERYVRDGLKAEPVDSHPFLEQRAACFVSLKTTAGELRGCIGTIEPSEESLREEIVSNAIGAATRDPRFPPVEPAELEILRYSVDVLSPPESARFEDLDPKVYGVIVEDEGGFRRGLLLPDIEGVDSVTQQVEIAAGKAGIPRECPLRFYRFRVDRFREVTEVG